MGEFPNLGICLVPGGPGPRIFRRSIVWAVSIWFLKLPDRLQTASSIRTFALQTALRSIGAISWNPLVVEVLFRLLGHL